MRKQLSDLSGIPWEQLVLYEVSDNRIVNQCTAQQPLSSILDTTVVIAYETSPPPTPPLSLVYIPLMIRRAARDPKLSGSWSIGASLDLKAIPVGIPQMLCVRSGITNHELYALAYQLLRRFVRITVCVCVTYATNQYQYPTATFDHAEKDAEQEQPKFQLKLVNKNGRSCSKCGPLTLCTGYQSIV